MDRLKKAWAWIRKNVVGLLVGTIAILGAGIFWGYHKRKIRNLEDHVAIKEAHRKVAGLDARREVLAEQAEENREAIAEIQEERVELQRQAVAIDQEVAEMSDEEVEAAFRALY